MVKIIQKRVGYSNSTLIVNGKNSILIDTGVKGGLNQFNILFKNYNLQPSDIKLIVLTHTHYDHTGNLHDLVNLTGAKVLVHRDEFENLKNGFTPIPKGTIAFTRFISGLGKILMPKFASPQPFTAHIISGNEFDLNEFGNDGKVIHTPGHSSGSQSVIIGSAIISGDTFVNMRNGSVFPPFADDPEDLLRSWQIIFKLGIKDIYPGHGSKMKVEKTIPAFEKWKKKLKIDF